MLVYRHGACARSKSQRLAQLGLVSRMMKTCPESLKILLGDRGALVDQSGPYGQYCSATLTRPLGNSIFSSGREPKIAIRTQSKLLLRCSAVDQLVHVANPDVSWTLSRRPPSSELEQIDAVSPSSVSDLARMWRTASFREYLPAPTQSSTASTTPGVKFSVMVSMPPYQLDDIFQRVHCG
jgi:hypothetical protein